MTKSITQEHMHSAWAELNEILSYVKNNAKWFGYGYVDPILENLKQVENHIIQAHRSNETLDVDELLFKINEVKQLLDKKVWTQMLTGLLDTQNPNEAMQATVGMITLEMIKRKRYAYLLNLVNALQDLIHQCKKISP